MKIGMLLVAGAFACTAATAADVAPPDMVTIPAGSFMLGSNDGPPDEQPAHPVELRAFAIDRLPVTNARFAEFLTAIGTHNKSGERMYDFDDSDARIHRRESQWTADAGYANHPAVEPTWAGARDYCAWRGKRLPTEAEWEKAARGTDGRKYPWGNAAPDASRARFGARFNETAPVDAFPGGASPYGVLGMAGNVWEWVSSAYRPILMTHPTAAKTCKPARCAALAAADTTRLLRKSPRRNAAAIYRAIRRRDTTTSVFAAPRR